MTAGAFRHDEQGPSWFFTGSNRYKGQIATFTRGGTFVESEWQCLHEHRTREEATACARSQLAEARCDWCGEPLLPRHLPPSGCGLCDECRRKEDR